ncbi:hypothetical protein CG740_05025 [Streptomyces sp. CB01201]|uniref:hypothetical protein n=1 Tax=Streptomyces sp. CB01201 TaxID=2020324 RepID=UPI000C270C6D|nr:hypothetical protein [Streptomyces sp. CB01201]PJN03771.1 hypothetical protein CG740_05025 [Streptomyces sp. CB01201]
MTLVREWSYDGTELAWLQAGLIGTMDEGHVVAELVPDGFEAYLRVFHRFEASDGSGRTRSWRGWAGDSGVRFHGELSHWSLPDEGRHEGATPLWLAQSGQLDQCTERALVRVLGEVTGDGRPVSFAYDLEALLWGADAPVVRRSSVYGLDEVRKEVAAELGSLQGPEFWWPTDRSWVVTSDCDLLSTYIGCSAETAERILANREIEALPVAPQTRVDWYSDRLNPNLMRATNRT